MNFKSKESGVGKIAGYFCGGLAHAGSDFHDYFFTIWKYLGWNYWVIWDDSEFLPKHFGGLCLGFGDPSSTQPKRPIT
jgi:hypothetical protein